VTPRERFLAAAAEMFDALMGAIGAAREPVIRWATKHDNPFGSSSMFLKAGARGDFETFRRGRMTVARWADVEASILARKKAPKRRPVAPVPEKEPTARERRLALLHAAGALPGEAPPAPRQKR